MLVKLAAIFAKLTLCYEHREERPVIGWYEYQIKGSISSFVPLYEEADRIRAFNFWKKDWDAPDLLEEEE